MTDMQRYIEFLKSLGFVEEDSPHYDLYPEELDDKRYLICDKTKAQRNPGLYVYLGSGGGASFSYSWFYFDADGKFINYGAD